MVPRQSGVVGVTASRSADRTKRLLVLGAGPAQLGLLRAARRRGLFVIACDRDPNAIGFEFADRRALVSAEDEAAIAAYNAGQTHVDRWVADAGGAEDFDGEEDARFPETRNYVRGVMERREDYRDHYARELGL